MKGRYKIVKEAWLKLNSAFYHSHKNVVFVIKNNQVSHPGFKLDEQRWGCCLSQAFYYSEEKDIGRLYKPAWQVQDIKDTISG